MTAIGGQRMLMPSLLPAALWKQSGRWDTAGKELIRLHDRKGEQFCLAPTHEEVITKLVASDLKSYRELPLRLYQIGPKFRDEGRPRFGLLRGREFIMKDMYSFDKTVEEAVDTYEAVKQAYDKIFDQLGIPYSVAEADAGSIGGSRTHEYHATCAVGEDTLIRCTACSYRANVEKAVGNLPAEEANGLRQQTVLPQRDTFASILAQGTMGLRGHLVNIIPSPGEKPTPGALVVLPSGREVNPIALKQHFGDRAEIVRISALPEDFAFSTPLKVLLDDSISLLSEPVLNALLESLPKNSLRGTFRAARAGDLCASSSCSSATVTLAEEKGIELGHIFYLGTKYSEKLNARVLYPDKLIPIEMGCYGLGVTRIVSAVVEACHDVKGIKWPLAIAPYKVVIVVFPEKLTADDETQRQAEEIYDLVQSVEGFSGEVVLDDRADSPGYKMKEAQLLGFPFMIICGQKTRSTGQVEIEERATGLKTLLDKSKLAEFLRERSQIL